MIAFSKFVELYDELYSSISMVEKHLTELLGYDLEVDDGVLIDFGVDGEKEFTIYYFDSNEDFNRRALVGEKDYSTMMQITSKEELLSFLDERVIC